jgi:hypothetical protein
MAKAKGSKNGIFKTGTEKYSSSLKENHRVVKFNKAVDKKECRQHWENCVIHFFHICCFD